MTNLLEGLNEYAEIMFDLGYEDAGQHIAEAAKEIKTLRSRVKRLEEERRAVARALLGCEPVAIPMAGDLEKMATDVADALRVWIDKSIAQRSGGAA